MSMMSVPLTASVASKQTVSLAYLYLLRAGYALLAIGLGFTVWPSVLQHAVTANTPPLWHGLTTSLLAAIGLLAILGLRYPLKMLPLLFFEITWKVIWLSAVALPAWATHAPIDADMADTINACLMVVIFPLILPWRYVFANFVVASGDRWK